MPSAELPRPLLQIRSVFQQHQSPDVARYQKTYLRNKFEFIGLKSSIRKELSRNFLNRKSLPPYTEAKKWVHIMWNWKEREFQYLAMEMLARYHRDYQKEDIEFIEELIISKSWWDTVDFIATHIAGKYFLKFPEQIYPVVDKWLKSHNTWLQRTCLIFQLKYREKTDTETLSRTILHLKNHKDFFIRKAIGWALRQYARTNENWVKDFLKSHSLHSLSYREATKHLKL